MIPAKAGIHLLGFVVSCNYSLLLLLNFSPITRKMLGLEWLSSGHERVPTGKYLAGLRPVTAT